MSSEKSLTPQIRFKGFTEAWEQRKVNELCKIGTGKSNTQDQVPNGFYPFYIRSDVPVRSNKYLYDCEAVITIGDGNIGKVFHYVNGKFDLHQRCYKMTEFQDIWGKYFYYFFSTKFYNRAVKMTAKATVDSVRLEMISEMDVSKPIQINEQRKISDLFTTIDNLITLHQRKLDALKKIKSALLEKMFPKNGSNVPEIRFTGFTEAWEQRKLGELMEVTSVRRVHQDEWTTQGVRFLRARDLVAYANNTEIELPLYISKELYEKYTAQSGKVEIGDLLVTGVGTIGVPWLVETPSPVYFKDGNIIWFKNKNAIYGKYFYYAFTSAFIQNFIKESAGTGTVGTYTIDTGKKTPIYIPPTFEQHKIASAMKRFDSLITLHQRKLDALKKIKSALLEKMFV